MATASSGALVGVRAHRWVDVPPSSGLTVMSLRTRVHRRGGECRLLQVLIPEHTPTSDSPGFYPRAPRISAASGGSRGKIG
jgi:hypothetical protein